MTIIEQLTIIEQIFYDGTQITRCNFKFCISLYEEFLNQQITNHYN